MASCEKTYEMWKWFLRKKQSETIIKIAKKSLNPFKEINENLLVFWNEIKGEKTLVLELCSGSRALVSLFNVLYNRGVSIAVDIRSPVSLIKSFTKTGRFFYITADIFDKSLENELEEIVRGFSKYKKVLVALHCCKMLSPRAIEIGYNLNFDKIVVVPCCVEREWAEKILNKKFEKYEDWVEALRKYLEIKGYKTKTYKERAFKKEEYFIIGLRDS